MSFYYAVHWKYSTAEHYDLPEEVDDKKLSGTARHGLALAGCVTANAVVFAMSQSGLMVGLLCSVVRRAYSQRHFRNIR